MKDGTGPNVAPVALNQSLETDANTALPFALSFDDPDGPGPYGFTVAEEPAFGGLSEIDSWASSPISRIPITTARTSSGGR